MSYKEESAQAIDGLGCAIIIAAFIIGFAILIAK